MRSLTAVDFPAPLGPRRATTSPRRSVRERLSRATTPLGNRFVTWLSEATPSIGGHGAGTANAGESSRTALMNRSLVELDDDKIKYGSDANEIEVQGVRKIW